MLSNRADSDIGELGRIQITKRNALVRTGDRGTSPQPSATLSSPSTLARSVQRPATPCDAMATLPSFALALAWDHCGNLPTPSHKCLVCCPGWQTHGLSGCCGRKRCRERCVSPPAAVNGPPCKRSIHHNRVCASLAVTCPHLGATPAGVCPDRTRVRVLQVPGGRLSLSSAAVERDSAAPGVPARAHSSVGRRLPSTTLTVVQLAESVDTRCCCCCCLSHQSCSVTAGKCTAL